RLGDTSARRAAKLSEKERKFWRGLRVVFVTNHPEQTPVCPELTVRKTNTPRAVFALARARVWVDNNRKEAYIRKRKGQYYIQLWHGGLALKKIEGDCAQVLGAEYIRRARKDSAATDLFVSNSDFCTQMYRRAFWAACEIAEYGSPRNDRFVRLAREAAGPGSLRTRPRPRRAVYAPTYRTGRKSFCAFDAEKLRAALGERFGGEWEILVRLHPLAAEGRDLREIPGVKDISGEPDLYEILYETDVLITDYSNTMFEFGMTGRPVFLYAEDIGVYERERGLYFDFEALPFAKADTAEELYRQIREYDSERYREELRQLYVSVGLKESGRAAHLVAERIAKKCAGETKGSAD
ncbi:MAG: CDP-glycerol glycerophosphotransferase family protein, partial [Lachnospiraceae bacterium]|nr:CDP-glycerol glycerophosphotransferase family protein [Lachnospiraceae bacterium]